MMTGAALASGFTGDKRSLSCVNVYSPSPSRRGLIVTGLVLSRAAPPEASERAATLPFDVPARRDRAAHDTPPEVLPTRSCGTTATACCGPDAWRTQNGARAQFRTLERSGSGIA